MDLCIDWLNIDKFVSQYNSSGIVIATAGLYKPSQDPTGSLPATVGGRAGILCAFL